MMQRRVQMLQTFPKRSIKCALIVTILQHHCIVLECKGLEDYTEKMTTDNPPVEVAAVFINCELDDNKNNPESEATRFEREELFKHNALRDCNKKLALTVKMTSEPTSSGDEYVPIDHVLEGCSKERVRLLDPYVLRLRRDLPLQAYKLRLIDTVRGILTMSDESTHGTFQEFGKPFKRNQRHIKYSQKMEEWQSAWGPGPGAASAPAAGRGCPLRPAALPDPSSNKDAAPNCAETMKNCEHNLKRFKRQEHEQNVIIEEDMGGKNIPDNLNGVLYQKNQKDRFSERSADRSFKEHIFQESQLRSHGKDKQRHANTREISVEENTKDENKKRTSLDSELDRRFNDGFSDNAVEASDKDFALYEIGSPDLWFKIHVQMFEKLSTNEGNTLWNDISKGELVSVSSLSPEWSGQDMSVQYRPADYVAREEFTLPMTSLCLLVPLPGEHINTNTISSNSNSPADNDENYIVVPSQDVVNADNIGNLKNRHANFSSEENTKGRRKRVVVRVARALWNVMEDNLNIATHGSEKYLTMLHRKPHHAQVELEVRADENQLVRIGSSGRVAIVVADSTRPARSTITVQATNMGLAAARFRALLRECDSGLLDLAKAGDGAIVAGPVLIPPRHVRRLRLEMPVDLPPEPQHCSVSLINDKEESVAVRDVVVRRGDRCFCVWHCDCVCAGENTKLPCQEMSAARQAAAGLPPRRYARFARSACYADEMPLNFFVIVIGVIIALLTFGLVKGVIGLCVPAVGAWGLDRVLRARTLPRYYESALSGRCVRYDAHGWPVHPDTYQRTVQVLSKPMELILNILFFVLAPGLIIVESLKRAARRGDSCDAPDAGRGFDSRDMQRGESRMRRGRDALSRWMTPQAEELSANIWQKDSTLEMCHWEYDTRPLLCAGAGVTARSPAGSDSELDDTAFVLMHIRNSTESLTRSQKKNNASSPSAAPAKHQNQHQCLGRPHSEIQKH